MRLFFQCCDWRSGRCATPNFVPGQIELRGVRRGWARLAYEQKKRDTAVGHLLCPVASQTQAASLVSGGPNQGALSDR